MRLLLLLLISVSCFAQGAKLKGVVYRLDVDGSRKPLSEAIVRLEGTALSKYGYVETVTDVDGLFLLEDLPPGDYTLQISQEGFQPYFKTYKLLPGSVDTLEVVLQLEEMSEVVEIKAEDSSGIDRSQVSIATKVTDRVLRNAPLANERFQEALPLVPGVVRGPDGILNVKGTRAGQSGLLVNSANVTDPVTGDYAISLPLEAVQSVTVLSSPYLAEYGRFTGAVTTVSTRSGGDKWRFLFTNFTPRLRRRIDERGRSRLVGIESFTPRLILTGPLIKSKLSISQSFEYKFVRTRVPSLPELRNDTVLETFDSFTQLDYVINQRNTLTSIVSFFPQNSSFVNLNTFNSMEVTPNFRQRGFFISTVLRSVVSQSGLLESNFSVKRFNAFVFPQGDDPMIVGVERNSGNYFNRQSRYSTRYEGFASYSVSIGKHQLKLGTNSSLSTFDGFDTSKPVLITRADSSLAQEITFLGDGRVSAKVFEQSFFVQDKLLVGPRLGVDFGLRYDFSSLARQHNFAPRFGFVLVPFADGKTVVRGGIGIFYDKLPLGTGVFDSLQGRQIVFFLREGGIVSKQLFTTGTAGQLVAPYSISSTLEIDRRIYKQFYLRVGLQKRNGHSEFIVIPEESKSQILLSNMGRSSYTELQLTARYKVSDSDELSVSYVRSRSYGDLNDYNSLYGNFRQPLIRPNERGRLAFDVPDRLLLSGTAELPLKLILAPLVEIRTGFPYAVVDEEQRYVSRNIDRFPRFFSIDLQVMRPIAIPFKDKKIKARVGVKIFNLTNHFNPRDVQSNLASSSFGSFYNSVPRIFRGKFEFDF
ncbi:MAG: carboxypeptidase regulatory-like domain-containing protein [Acidobacteriota bacterium]|nr:carboxypeptidase regulatory-like domain-containing protein [Blastocatellia bacterium]MDW8412352.1 carboxypeptidase regulatory-like domain-containing protein [Acidobacteriota bacterium]